MNEGRNSPLCPTLIDSTKRELKIGVQAIVCIHNRHVQTYLLYIVNL